MKKSQAMKFRLNSVNQNQNKMPLGLATEEGRKGRNERNATATTSARKNENCAIDTPTFVFRFTEFSRLDLEKAHTQKPTNWKTDPYNHFQKTKKKQECKTRGSFKKIRLP
ncbi:Hypothetical predicted protein [Podarcis lilfordi]|uniref:Uncharacterized protein n=1 Tax=Podarcis lilfordi TaxID=74358 RepID=A0AA35KCR0_9SAUR|nr:Hypothetical predicted protein [Podarcis lilfordi]